MPKLLPVHYHPSADAATVCETDVLAAGVLLGTTDPHGVTCSRCITSPLMSGMTPITREEHAALVSRASRSVREFIEPFHEWAARQGEADARRVRHIRALDELYLATPWWAFRTRRLIREAVMQA